MKTNRPNIYSHESQQTGLNPHRFLLAVATLEYAQTQPAIHTITLPQDPHQPATITATQGQPLTLPLTTSSDDLYQALLPHLHSALNRPCTYQPDISNDPQQTWPNLLDDFGSYYGVFSEESPPHSPIHLTHLHNHHQHILITLTQGGNTHRFSYEHGGYPAALPVSLTFLILNPDSEPSEPELRRSK